MSSKHLLGFAAGLGAGAQQWMGAAQSRAGHLGHWSSTKGSAGGLPCRGHKGCPTSWWSVSGHQQLVDMCFSETNFLCSKTTGDIHWCNRRYWWKQISGSGTHTALSRDRLQQLRWKSSGAAASRPFWDSTGCWKDLHCFAFALSPVCPKE